MSAHMMRFRCSQFYFVFSFTKYNGCSMSAVLCALPLHHYGSGVFRRKNPSICSSQCGEWMMVLVRLGKALEKWPLCNYLISTMMASDLCPFQLGASMLPSSGVCTAAICAQIAMMRCWNDAVRMSKSNGRMISILSVLRWFSFYIHRREESTLQNSLISQDKMSLLTSN